MKHTANTNDSLIYEVDRDKLPDGLDPKIGQQLESIQSDGRRVVVTVSEVAETSVNIDANHPLAGKELVFDIELLEIL